MPDYYPAGTQSNAALLGAYLADLGVGYADLFSAFRSEDDVLYFRTDSHWNGKGAALAADVILGQTSRPTEYYERPFSDGEPHLGDLYEMLYPAGRETEGDFVPQEGFSFAYATEPNGGNAIRFETTCTDGEGSLVCWRDSFGISLHPYLAQQFALGYFTRSADYDMTLAADREADVVVIELVERELSRLWEYAPVLPAPVRCVEAEAAEACVQGAYGEAAEGYVQLRIPVEDELTDGFSPVYVQVGDTVYEACVFFEEAQRIGSVYISEEQSEGAAALIAEKDGGLRAYPVILK